jgi:hypothetical protein
LTICVCGPNPCRSQGATEERCKAALDVAHKKRKRRSTAGTVEPPFCAFQSSCSGLHTSGVRDMGRRIDATAKNANRAVPNLRNTIPPNLRCKNFTPVAGSAVVMQINEQCSRNLALISRGSLAQETLGQSSEVADFKAIEAWPATGLEGSNTSKRSEVCYFPTVFLSTQQVCANFSECPPMNFVGD